MAVFGTTFSGLFRTRLQPLLHLSFYAPDASLPFLPPRPTSSNSRSAFAHLPDSLDGPLNVQQTDSARSSSSVGGKKRS
ncbi:hypothetical protein Q3G72_019068 [Acer saccharum]|nr:hypothetical protein Q3G72_019068 [Acer saccharum]